MTRFRRLFPVAVSLSCLAAPSWAPRVRGMAARSGWKQRMRARCAASMHSPTKRLSHLMDRESCDRRSPRPGSSTRAAGDGRSGCGAASSCTTGRCFNPRRWLPRCTTFMATGNHTEGDALIVDRAEARHLPWQLGDSSNAIVIATARVQQSDPVRFVSNVWRGASSRFGRTTINWDSRPFVDAVDIRTSRSSVDQMTSVETGRADMV